MELTFIDITLWYRFIAFENNVACCLKAGISEVEQTSIASQRFDNIHIRGKE
jgi:hypothetical protein